MWQNKTCLVDSDFFSRCGRLPKRTDKNQKNRKSRKERPEKKIKWGQKLVDRVFVANRVGGGGRLILFQFSNCRQQSKVDFQLEGNYLTEKIVVMVIQVVGVFYPS